jgi:hypothetical protein
MLSLFYERIVPQFKQSLFRGFDLLLRFPVTEDTGLRIRVVLLGQEPHACAYVDEGDD